MTDIRSVGGAAVAGPHAPGEANQDLSTNFENTGNLLLSQLGYEGPPPRWRRTSRGETAKAAAGHMKPKSPTLRVRILAHVEERPGNPEDIFERLKRDGVRTVLTSVRPRMTELCKMGLVADSGRRAPGESGVCNSIVWRATTPQERADFAARKDDETEGEQ